MPPCVHASPSQHSLSEPLRSTSEVLPLAHHEEHDNQSLPQCASDNFSQPLMNDISTLLETMHFKSLTLKKLAEKQQTLIEQLRYQNDVLRLENERKDKAVHVANTRIATLERELSESKGSEISSDVGNEEKTTELLQNNTATFDATPRNKLPALLGDMQVSSSTVNCAAGIGAAGWRVEAFQGEDLGRIRQIVRKIENVGSNIRASSAVSNGYRISQFAKSATTPELARPDRHHSVGIALLNSS